MYPSYSVGLSGRSRSSLDVSKSYLDDDSPFPSSFSDLSRGRDRRAPTPPKRSDSISALDKESFKSTRSYLTEDVRRQFELGFESSRTKDDSELSPFRSRNFVKKLVATLERRQREEQITNQLRKPDRKSNFVQFRSSDSKSAAILRQPGKPVVIERFNSEPFMPRRPPSFLEDVQEDEDENEDTVQETLDTENDEDTDSDEFWNNVDTPSHNNNNKIHLNNNNNNSNSENEDSINIKSQLTNDTTTTTTITTTITKSILPEKSKMRRSLKNVFSALKSWKIGGALGGGSKSLPKGSRDYYATRESLGEEMRAFRRDTMPRLMRRVVIKGHLENKTEGQQQQREFNELIGSPNKTPADEASSIATIHPVYGCKTAQVGPLKLSRLQESAQVEKTLEPIYASKKVQLPAAPVPESSPPTEHLLRPSRVKDLQKRLSRELDAAVQLRKHNSSHSTSTIIYDVPRSNRRVSLELPPDDQSHVVQLHHHRTSPQYANLNFAIDEDKRLQCTTFTTF